MAIVKLQQSTRVILGFDANRTVFPIAPVTALGEIVETLDALPTGIAVGMVLSADGSSVSAYNPPDASLEERLAAVVRSFRLVYEEADRDFQPILVWERTDAATQNVGDNIIITWPEIIIRSWWKPWTRHMIIVILAAQGNITEARVATAETEMGFYTTEFSPTSGGLGMETWYNAANRQVWAAFANPGNLVYRTNAGTGGIFGSSRATVHYGAQTSVITWGMRAAVQSVNP